MTLLKIKPELILRDKRLRHNYDLVQGLIDDFPEKTPDLTIAEFAEKHRVLPPGTPYPGPWRNYRTPYAVEIMEALSANSRIQEIVWVKCSQIGATALLENFIAYIIRMVPGPALYVTAKEELARKWVNKRFYPLVLSCGLENHINAQFLMEGQRRRGNQQFSKEFPGGCLDIASAQSESNLRMDSVRYLMLDEAGRYPLDVQGFGDPIAIVRARTANWRSRRKIFIPSTPGLEGECRMWELFQEGDQRRWFLPCPHCGEFQVLRFPSEPTAFYEGFASAEIKWETKGGRLDKRSVYFLCDKCREPFFEKDKLKMAKNGQWVPTAKSPDSLKRSYQIGRLSSLMEDWERLVKIEIQATDSPQDLQAHHNHNCGIPYREVSVRLDKKRVYELRGGYKSGVIPSDKVLFLTGAVDVQRGSKSDPDKPPRLEMEICGHGYGYRTWSIMYKVFKGPIDDAYDGAWEDLYQFFESGRAEFSRSDGFVFFPPVVFVDSQDGQVESVVFDFCDRMKGFFPSKGQQDLKPTAKSRTAHILDEANKKDRDRFRENRKNGVNYVVISTNWYKRRLYRSLSISVKQRENNMAGNNYSDFPADYPDKYFDMLVAEEERADQSFWLPSGRANEALDMRVYNMCAADFWLFKQVQLLQKFMKKNGSPSHVVEQLNSKNILHRLQQEVKRKDPTPKPLGPSQLR